MHPGDLLTLLVAILMIWFVIFWRAQARRERNIAKRLEHRPHRPTGDTADDATLLQIGAARAQREMGG